MTIIDKLGYGKVCARLVPQMLSGINENIRKAISTDLLWHTTMEDRASCCRLLLVTKPSSTIMNLTPSGNCWNDTIWHPQGQRNSTVLLAGKIEVTVCWDNKRCYSWQLLAKWTIVNSNRHAETLKIWMLTFIEHTHKKRVWSVAPPWQH